MSDLVTGVGAARNEAAQSASSLPAKGAERKPTAEQEGAVTSPTANLHAEAEHAQHESKPITNDELAQMLRRINLTFDLFEIQARFNVSDSDHHVRVTLINTRTGEVIRRIPPYEFKANFDSFRDGLGLLINRTF
jgi:uncharacterized FlaG/YvyC family protein